MKAEVIFERDNWICQLCGTETVKAFRGTCHPLAPEVDHKDANRQNNDPSNLQCAHRACNERKNKFQGDDLAKIIFTPPECLNPYDVAMATKRMNEGCRNAGRTSCTRHANTPQGKACRRKGAHIACRSGKNADPNFISERGRKGGRSQKPGHHAEMGRISTHNYWHVRRGIVNPKCSLCAEAAK